MTLLTPKWSPFRAPAGKCGNLPKPRIDCVLLAMNRYGGVELFTVATSIMWRAADGKTLWPDTTHYLPVQGEPAEYWILVSLPTKANSQ